MYKNGLAFNDRKIANTMCLNSTVHSSDCNDCQCAFDCPCNTQTS